MGIVGRLPPLRIGQVIPWPIRCALLSRRRGPNHIEGRFRILNSVAKSGIGTVACVKSHGLRLFAAWRHATSLIAPNTCPLHYTGESLLSSVKTQPHSLVQHGNRHIIVPVRQLSRLVPTSVSITITNPPSTHSPLTKQKRSK